MLTPERQKRVNAIVQQIARLSFVDTVFQDDFDSSTVRIVLSVKAERSYAAIKGNTWKLQCDVRKVKNAIKRLLQRENTRFVWMDWPRLLHDRCKDTLTEQTRRIPVGHDSTRFSVDVVI